MSDLMTYYKVWECWVIQATDAIQIVSAPLFCDIVEYSLAVISYNGGIRHMCVLTPVVR